MSRSPAVRLLGQLLIFLGLALLLPGGMGLAYGERWTALSFLIGALVAALCGAALVQVGPDRVGAVHRRDALLVVGLGWVLCGAFGGLPLWIDGAVPTFTDAYFETISGFTTTGSTVLQNIEATSRGSLFWRSLAHWLGGMGIVVLFVAVLPQLGVGGKLLFQSEVPGPITEGLKPRIKETSAVLWRIYLALTVALTLILWSLGMGLFDSVNHAMATLATGGYSTRNASIAAYDSAAIDATITVFMLLAGVNFTIYYLIRQGSWRRAATDRELWTYLSIASAATLVVSISIYGRHGSALQSLRYGAFQVCSILTTTGFGTDDFEYYPPVSKLLLVMLMFIGGSAGSTAGGIKIYRVIVLWKACTRELTRAFKPQLVRAVRVGGSVVAEDVVRSVLAFFVLFLAIFAGATLFMAGLGLDMETAVTSVAATLGNIGPGLGTVGPTDHFAFIPTPGKWVLSLCMILGRLEIVTVAALLVPAFWRR